MEHIEITRVELASDHIDDAIAAARAVQPSAGEPIEDVATPFYLNPPFYYSLAAVLMAFSAWLMTEPFFDDHEQSIIFLSDYAMFGPVAGLIGFGIGLVYGLTNRNLRQALYCAVVGGGVGLVATVASTIVADIAFGITGSMAVAFAGEVGEEFLLTGFPFFVFLCGRGVAWSLVSIGAGLGLGVALKSRKHMLNGVAGGMVGGLLGGLLFDPIDRFLFAASNDAKWSRAVGTVAIGLLVGLFIGVFENISRDAWLHMARGPLTGKQFMLYKSPMVIGSTPKCDVYLFKDPAIEPRHATITKTGAKFLLKDAGSGAGTRVNGRPIDAYVLQDGDVVEIGDAILKYRERAVR